MSHSKYCILQIAHGGKLSWMQNKIQFTGKHFQFTVKDLPYSGKVWQGESLANLANRLRFAKLKPSKLVVTIDNPLADLFICQTFFCQMFEKSIFAKHSAHQTFPLCGIYSLIAPAEFHCKSFVIVKGTAKNPKVFHHGQFAIYGMSM